MNITKFVYIVFAFLLLSIQAGFAQDFLRGQEKETVEETPIPDPLVLSQDWWNYFDVPVQNLKPRIDAFIKELNLMLTSLNDGQHRPIIQVIEKIKFNLDLFLEKKELALSVPQTHLQFLEQYTFDEILRVNKNYLEVDAKLNANRDSLESFYHLEQRQLRKLDDLLLLYTAMPKSSYEKLKTGLEVIEKKLELAITQTQIQTEKQLRVSFRQELERLREELSIAQKRLTFESIDEASISNSLIVLSEKYKSSQLALFNQQKEAFYQKSNKPENNLFCCLWDHKVISQSIATEIAKLKLLYEEIKLYLYRLSVDPAKHSTSELQEKIDLLNQQIEETGTDIMDWERSLQDAQFQIGNNITQQFPEGVPAGSAENKMIVDIHLEIDRALAKLQELEIFIHQGELLITLMNQYLIKEKSFWETFWILLNHYVDYGTAKLVNFSEMTLFRVHNNPITIFNLFQALLIIFGARYVSKYLIQTIMRSKRVSKSLSVSNQYIISRSIHYLVIVGSFIIALTFIGLDFTNFFIFAGALGVAVGFGLQTMVNNIMSGFLLLFQRNIKVGDIVEVGPELIGRVISINLQNTHIKSFEGIDLIVPNGELTKQMLNNWTLQDSHRRFRVPFGVAYGTDKELVRRVVTEAAQKVPCTVRGDYRYPDPEVWLIGFGDSSINFELVVWVNLNIPAPHGTCVTTYNWIIETTLKENGIAIPFPQRDLYIKEVPEKKANVDQFQDLISTKSI